ncbi:hypothetical protein FACS1894186_3440 [Alphaproteobacteria bacterium]|nr:hypothetical protein FACS1894186_3440 [Alphaproteobacteria bacterium]
MAQAARDSTVECRNKLYRQALTKKVKVFLGDAAELPHLLAGVSVLHLSGPYDEVLRRDFCRVSVIGNKPGGQTVFFFTYDLDTGNYRMRKFGGGGKYEDFAQPSGILADGWATEDLPMPAAVSEWIFAQLDALAKSR